MATNNNIDEYLRQIREGRYGYDIRKAIHDALQKLWTLAESKEDSGGGDTPTPISDSQFMHGTLALNFAKAGDIFGGALFVNSTPDTVTRTQYFPLLPSSPPMWWDTEYTQYYYRTGDGTFAHIPEQDPYPEYISSKYFDCDTNVAPTDVKYSSNPEYVSSSKNKYRYWLVSSNQETTSGYGGNTAVTMFYDPDTKVFLMRVYTGQYTGPYMLVKSKRIFEENGSVKYFRTVMNETTPSDWESNYANYYSYDSETGIYFARTSPDDHPYVRGQYYTADGTVALYSGGYANGFIRVGGMGDDAYTIDGDAWYGVNTGYWIDGNHLYTSTSVDDWAPLDIILSGTNALCNNWSKEFARRVLSSIGAIPTYILEESPKAPSDWDDYAGNYYMLNSAGDYEVVVPGTAYVPAKYYKIKE